MKGTGLEKQGRHESIRAMFGSDPLTTALVGLACFLTAAVVALAVDLYRRPAAESLPAQASVARQPARATFSFPVELTPSPSLTASPGRWPVALPSLPPTARPISPPASPTAVPTPTPAPPPVRVRIPAISVDRSIVALPLTYDARSKTWERDYDRLFRRGKSDLVGHIEGSAAPGQPGNTILAGHNYGFGVKGVFVRLGRLKVGQQVEVVNAAGETFKYRITTVISIPWTKKNRQELERHQAYLAVGGAERLTLVTCGGSSWAPFPNRVYVVAAPAP